MSPAITFTDSSHREDVISGDDAVLSPTQLSKSIDMLSNGDDSEIARTSLTSVETFPCCHFHFAANTNSTFPLIFDNNPNYDHFKNISIHDLLSELKKRIKDEGNINNFKGMLKLERDQRMSAHDDKWKTIHSKLNFPVKVKERKSHRIKQFPCNIMDHQQRLSCITLSFPRNCKTAIIKFPCCTKIVETYSIDNKTNLKEMLKDKRFNIKSLREDIKSQRATYYRNNGKKEIRFPLKKKNKLSNDNKFPGQQMTSLEPEAKEYKFEYSAISEDTASVAQPRLHQERKAYNSPAASICFPVNLKTFNNNFPLHDNVQLPNRKFTIQKINLIAKSLQGTKPKSHANKPNELTMKFPFNNKQGQKSLKTFPLLSIESKYQIPFKTAKFPITFQSPKYKFPRDDNAKPINIKLAGKNIKSKFDSNKITKTLQQTNKQSKTILPENSITHIKFPLGTQQFYHNRDLYIKFPLNYVSTTTPLNRQSQSYLEKSVLPLAASFENLSPNSNFPLKLNQSLNKFPFEHRRIDRILISSIFEMKQKFQSSKIQKSCKIAPNQYEILNEKTLKKFPLKERMVKKLFRKFPNEKDIHTPLNKNKIFIGHLNFSNFPNNTVNNFTTTTNLDKEVKPPMTPNLYKQHGNSSKEFDNEKHASQIHVENPFGKTKATKKTLIPRPVDYKKDKKISKTHNVVDNALYIILPTIEAKNISLTTTKTARDIGQCAENFEQHNNALINIRDNNNNNNNGNISLASVGTKLSQKNIINSSFNHRNECDIGSGSILRASTPPMSAITSVQNTERHHNTLQVAGGGGGSSDLCNNPQVAQIVECSSEVRDTFSTTVDNGGVSSRPTNSSKTGSIFDKNQNESLTTTPPHALALTQTSLSTSSSPSSHFTDLNVVSNVASSPNDRTSFKERKNSSNSSELLPKYSVLELCDSNVINCPDQDRIQIKGIICQDKEKERAVVNSHEIVDDQLVLDLKKNINANFEIYDKYDQQLLDNLLSVQISDFEFDLDDSKEIDEMKIEMKRSKGALPNTAPASARNAGKLEESVAAASYNRSKSHANNGYPKGPADRVLTGTPQSSAYRSALANDVSSGGRSSNDRLSTTSTNSLSRPSTAVRRLSNDYGSPRMTSSTPAATAYQRNASNNPTLSSSSLSANYTGDSGITANRYNNDSTSTANTPKPKYVRRPTSGALLSLDVTNYTPSSEASSAASVSRSASFDTISSTDYLPQRTRLRRQSRFRPQSSQDEDPIERLNRLKAQISASLSEVKGVLQHYSTDEEDKQKQVIPARALSIQPLEKVKEDPVKEEKEQEGPVTFRFVKTIRRRSFFDDDADVGQKDAAAVEVDRGVTPNELGVDEVDRGVIQRDTSPLKLPKDTTAPLKEFVNQQKLATEATEAAKLPSESLSKPVIQIEDSEPQSQDIGPQQKVTTTAELELPKDVQMITESQSNNRVIDNVPMPEQVDPLKEQIKSEEIQSEQIEKNDSTAVNLDKKVNETKTQTKNVQTHKVKPIKKVSQKRETKTGKSTSKIPQRIEKANTVNDSKLESKQSASNSVLCAESKETPRVERSSPKNTENIPKILSKEEIKKSGSDKKQNESMLLLPETTKNKSATVQQTSGHIETKEKQDTKELAKVKQDSMAKPTIKENEKLETSKENIKTKDLTPKPKLLKQKSTDIVKEDENNKVSQDSLAKQSKDVIGSNTEILSVANKEARSIDRSSPKNTEDKTKILSKDEIKKSQSDKKQNENMPVLQETTKDKSATVQVKEHNAKDIKTTKSDQQKLGHIETKEKQNTVELTKVKNDSMAKPTIKDNEKLVTTKENRETKDLSPQPKLLTKKPTDIVKEDEKNKVKQDSLPKQSKDVIGSNTGSLIIENKETRRIDRSSPKNTEDKTKILSKEEIKKPESDKKLLLQETMNDKSPTVQVQEHNAKDIKTTKSDQQKQSQIETKEKQDTQELVKVQQESITKPIIKEKEKLATTKENRKTKELSPKPKLLKPKTTDIVKEDEKNKTHQDSLPNKDIILVESNIGETKITKDTSPKPKPLEKKETEKVVIADFNKVNVEILSKIVKKDEVLPSLPNAIKPHVKIEGIQVSDLNVAENCQNLTTDSNISTPVEIRKNFTIKPRDPMRRASLAAVEGSKIELPVHLAAPGTIQRRPSDSEAMLKKKLITTKTITSGSIEEVTPKPKIIKAKRSSAMTPSTSTVATSNDTRQQLAATQVVDSSTENRNDHRMKQAATPLGANKTIQGDKNKDVTMPNNEMPTQMPPQIPTYLNNTTKSLVGQNNRTQLMINEASMDCPPSPSSLTRKPLELDASRATNEKATATTTNLAASKFENSEGGAMLANSKPTVVSSTTASAVNDGPKETVRSSSSQQDLLDLLQQESVVYIKTSQNASNKLKTDDNRKGENTHTIRPTNLEVSAKELNEPLQLNQQQVVKTTDILDTQFNDDIGNVQATNIDIVHSTASKASPSVTADQHILQEQQQKDITPTTTTTKIEEKATTKANDSPQFSISSQETTNKDTTHLKAPTQTTSPSSIPETETLQSESKGLEAASAIMPELQVTPAPVQTAELPHGPHKKKVIIKKIIRQNSVDKIKKAEEKAESTVEQSAIPEIVLDKHTEEGLVTGEDIPEANELATEESLQSEAAAIAIKPKKVRKVKKKVIIKRQKRRLSVSGDSFFSHDPTEAETVIPEIETLEKPIAFVSDEEQDEEPENEVIEEKKPLKPCMSKKEFEIGDEVVFGERIKRTQIKWRRGRVKERTSCISYLLDIDGVEVSSHVNYLKKYTNRKVNFGGKEYLEIDYEQLAEDEERAERVKQRTVSIWNMV